MRRLILTIAAAAGTTAVASAQITPIGPFTGPYTESFQTQTPGQFTQCVIGRVFDNTADLCDTTGNGAHITGGWGFMCSIGPHSGTLFFGSAGGPAQYKFDSPVQKFGGYFGTNSGTDNGKAIFYDVNNNELASLEFTTAGCTWTWNGWESTSANIKAITFIGANPFGGGFVDMDDMEYDLGGGGQCKWDLDGDGVVCQGDLGILLAGYGTIYSQSDLGGLLAEFGTCGGPCP
jgi:hypothetical protein